MIAPGQHREFTLYLLHLPKPWANQHLLCPCSNHPRTSRPSCGLCPDAVAHRRMHFWPKGAQATMRTSFRGTMKRKAYSSTKGTFVSARPAPPFIPPRPFD
jgi:hypothetical protein